MNKYVHLICSGKAEVFNYKMKGRGERKVKTELYNLILYC